MNQDNTKLQNILGIYLLIGIAVTVALGWLVIKPVMKNAKDNANQVAATNQQIAALNKLDDDTKKLRQSYDQNHLKDKRDQILALLPADNQEESLMPLLNNMAQGNGVVMSTFAPADNNSVTATAPGGISSSLSLYPASININGDYLAFQQFLLTLENGARFVDITAASLSGGDKGVQARLTLTAYYQKSQTSAAASQTSTAGVHP